MEQYARVLRIVSSTMPIIFTHFSTDRLPVPPAPTSPYFPLKIAYEPGYCMFIVTAHGWMPYELHDFNGGASFFFKFAYKKVSTCTYMWMIVGQIFSYQALYFVCYS